MSEFKADKINDGIYYVGFGDDKAGFSNNPYLLVEGDSVVLFDPGSRREDHFLIIKKKIESVVPLNKITHIVVHHQDPDLVASVPLFEEILGVNNFELISTMRTSLLIPYYGIYTDITTVEDGDVMEIDNGRKIMFITSPYLHFPGAHVSYDEKTKTLFSSDIFGAFTSKWTLFADEAEDYIQAMKIFHEPYIPHRDCVMSFINKVKNLPIEMICPQHGSVIRKDIPKYVKALTEFEVGKWL